MNKICIVLAFAFLSLQVVASRPCSKCNGSGKMTIFHPVATYGVNGKHQCPICKNWIPDGVKHTETCDQCHGKGYVESATDNRNNGQQDRANEGLSYLTPAELSYYQSLSEQLKGHDEPVKCHACQGSGHCHVCHGTGMSGSGSCWVCSGIGKCISCYGTGISRWIHVDPTEAERKDILSKMAQLLKDAMNRNQ